MKLVHKSLTAAIAVLALLTSALADTTVQESNSTDYLRFYNPATGFKPAQPSLAQIFLQIAGSLEHTGSPEFYLRHMQREHARISAKYSASTGQTAPSRLPAHMTPEYIARTIANWNVLGPNLDLEALAKEIGRCVREGIRGTRDTGTLAVEILNQHQKLVVAQMQSTSPQTANFEQLRGKLESQLEFNNRNIDTTGYETTRRDAVTYASLARVTFERLFQKIDAAVPAQKAAQIKSAITGFFLDLGRMAQSELEIAVLEMAAS